MAVWLSFKNIENNSQYKANAMVFTSRIGFATGIDEFKTIFSLPIPDCDVIFKF